VFLLVCAIALVIVRTISNLRQPVPALSSRVVAKRSQVSGGINNMPASTSYYVTFETADADERWEFPVSSREYGMLAEGDRSTLSRQGTWYKGFERQRSSAGR